MPEGTELSPADFAKLWAAKKGGGAATAAAPAASGRELSPEDFAKAWAAKKGGGEGIPKDPVQEWEGGGLQQPTIDPIMAATTIGTGGVLGGLKGAADVALSYPLAQKGQELAHYAAQSIPGTGPVSQVARGTLEQVGGIAPFMAAGALPGAENKALSLMRGEKSVGEAAQGAANKAVAETATTPDMATRAQYAKQDVADVAAQQDKAADARIAQSKRGLETGAQAETAQTAKETEQAEAKASLPPAGKGAMEAGPERIQRGEEFRDKSLSPLRRYGADWESRRQGVIGGHGDDMLPDTDLQGIVAEERARTPAADLSPKIQALFNKIAPKFGKAANSGEAYLDPGQRLVSVNDLLGWQSEAKAIARSGSKAEEAVSAGKVSNTIDQMLENHLNLPELKKLNAEYRDYRSHIPYTLEGTIQQAPNPQAAAKDIFHDPVAQTAQERVMDLMKKSNPEEQGHWRQMYGDYLRSGGKPDPVIAKTLGIPGPLAKPEALMYADKAAKNTFISPQAQAKLGAELSRVAQAENEKVANAIVKEGLAGAKSLGPAGKQIVAQIYAAKTPEEQAQVVIKAFGEMQPEQVAGQAREEAGVHAIQNYDPNKAYGLRNRITNYASRMLAIGGLMAAFGRPYMIEAGVGGYAITAIPNMVQKAWLNSLKDPAEALAMFRALQGPGTPKSLETISRAIISSVAPSAAIGASKAASAKPDMAFGKALADKHAAVIAGPHASKERIDTIKGVSKKIGAGIGKKPPDVTNKLKHGVVSLENVRDMMDQHGGNADVASVFKGLSAQDAIGLLAKASPEQRDMLLPGVAQKIQDEGTGKPPQAQQQLMAALRAAMREGAEA